MEIGTERIGKLAIIAAISSDEEEARLKEQLAKEGHIKLTITYLSGRKCELDQMFVRSLVAAALKGHTIPEKTGAIHAVIHAGIEAWQGMTTAMASSSNMKVKVAIVADDTWLVIAVYGVSAMHLRTNHERMGMGVMHL